MFVCSFVKIQVFKAAPSPDSWTPPAQNSIGMAGNQLNLLCNISRSTPELKNTLHFFTQGLVPHFHTTMIGRCSS